MQIVWVGLACFIVGAFTGAIAWALRGGQATAAVTALEARIVAMEAKVNSVFKSI